MEGGEQSSISLMFLFLNEREKVEKSGMNIIYCEILIFMTGYCSFMPLLFIIEQPKKILYLLMLILK